MRPLGKAVIRSGLVDENIIAEMKRWGLPVHTDAELAGRDEQIEIIQDPDMIVKVLQDALDSADQVRLQDTDLDIVQRWVDPKKQITGKLFMKNGEDKATRKVIFCWTVMKEIALPWSSESIVDLLCNQETHLKFEDDKGVKRKLFFTDARELYIGDTKAFIVCTPFEEK